LEAEHAIHKPVEEVAKYPDDVQPVPQPPADGDVAHEVQVPVIEPPDVVVTKYAP